jgi:hypothetical protein
VAIARSRAMTGTSSDGRVRARCLDAGLHHACHGDPTPPRVVPADLARSASSGTWRTAGATYLGKLVEMGTATIPPPSHLYTRAFRRFRARSSRREPAFGWRAPCRARSVRSGAGSTRAVPTRWGASARRRSHRCSAPERITGLRATPPTRCDASLLCSPRRLLRTALAPSRMEVRAMTQSTLMFTREEYEGRLRRCDARCAMRLISSCRRGGASLLRA